MNKIFKNEIYKKLNNNDDDYITHDNQTKTKNKSKIKSLKDKIIEKTCPKNLNITRCFIILILIIIFIFSFTGISKNNNISKIEEKKKVKDNKVDRLQDFENKDNNTENTENVEKDENTENVEKDENTENTTNIETKIEKKDDYNKNNITDKNEFKKDDNYRENNQPKNYSSDEIIPKNEDIYREEKFNSLTDSFNKAKNFLTQSQNGVLIQDKNKFILCENPKISIVIPVYNSKNLITKTIKSIQNQDIFDFEILLINDFSTDDTLSLIEKFQKEDPRIKILKNKKNMGTLYTRSIGTLSAKGEYIIPLDNDDMLLDSDVLSTLYNISNKGNFDILEYKGILLKRRSGTNIFNSKKSDIAYTNHKLNLVMFQPELSDYPVKPGKDIGTYILQDVYLWNKCIKTDIYQKALNKLGQEKYSRYMLAHEDVIAMIFLFNTANSFKFIGKYGILHIERVGSAYFKTKEIEMNIKELYMADVAIEFASYSQQNRKLLPYLIINVLNIKILEKILNQSDYNKKLLNSCLDRVLNSKFISDELKNEIRKIGKQKKFINYPF